MTKKVKVDDQLNDNVLLVTQERFDEMQNELNERIERRAEIANEIEEARSLGDLSENEPYTSAMQKKEINDAKIEELEDLLRRAQIIQPGVVSGGAIGIGSIVTIETTDTKSAREIVLVGKQETQEADPRLGKVSIDSPIGVALRGRMQGDTIDISLPTGLKKYLIKKVA